MEGGVIRVSLGVVMLFTPLFVHAATLSIDPEGGTFGPGDTFVLTVRLDTGLDECVNATTIELRYPTDWMKASAVSKGESLLTLWTEEPKVDHENGIVRFEGGIPAGYCGRIQGDPGKTNVLAKVIFSIPGNMIGGKVATGPEPLPVSFGPATVVLLNDGFGTPAPLTLVSGAYTRVLTSLGRRNEWLDIVQQDNIAPDLFSIALESEKNTFQGKYFIIFSTVDKQSGVHHYEVMEDDPQRFGLTRTKEGEKALFVSATSPYVLSDQQLGSRVIVRAFDHAGNVQEAIMAPRSGTSTSVSISNLGSKENRTLLYALGGVMLVIVLGILGFAIYRRRQRLGISDMST